jgi:beta-N-acetylhexosaminidase
MKAILPAFLSVQGTELTDAEKRLFAEYNPLGVCLFAIGCANVENKIQLQNLVKQIKETIGREDVLIAVDQEGGRVRRLPEPEWTAVASQSVIDTKEKATCHAKLISRDLKNCGINVNFAPVLDVEYDYTNAVLKGRCFSSDEQEVALLGRVMVDTYEKCGVCPCIKHLPGHGRGRADPHLQLPAIEEDLKTLEKDFYPFKQLADAPMGMAAHIVLKAVDAENPATFSEKVISEIIRKNIGFKGLLVSDAIVMQALKGRIAERAERCVEAGCDVVCLGNADFAANMEICNSKIKMKDDTLERLEKIFTIIKKPLSKVNYENLQNKYCRGVKNIISYNYEYDATEILNKLRKQ